MHYKINMYLTKNEDSGRIVQKYLSENFSLKRNMLYINYLHDSKQVLPLQPVETFHPIFLS